MHPPPAKTIDAKRGKKKKKPKYYWTTSGHGVRGFSRSSKRIGHGESALHHAAFDHPENDSIRQHAVQHLPLSFR